MHPGPILASLSRHKLTVAMLVLDVMLTCAVIANVAYIFSLKAAAMNQRTGLDEAGLVIVETEKIGGAQDEFPRQQENITAIKSVPGVRNAAALAAFPFGNDLVTKAGSDANDPQGLHTVSVSAFYGTQGVVDTLGLKLAAGRDFLPEEYVRDEDGGSGAAAVVVTRALAQKLFRTDRPVGRYLYLDGGRSARVVGVVEKLLRPNPTAARAEENDYSIVLPIAPKTGSAVYAIAVQPSADTAGIVNACVEALARNDRERVVGAARTFAEIKDDFFRRDRVALQFFLAAASGLLIVTAAGVFGLASFWVQQRRRSIGIRRAVGANRKDILKYFLAENFLIVSLGIAASVLVAYVINSFAMRYYGTGRLPPHFLIVGACAVWIAGQAAALVPAIKAAAIPPGLAARAR